jgi:G3E family GTPase
MKLLVIAGFLGSGKTTLLLSVARRLAGAGQRIAIIENEVGKVGIDDRVLEAEGLSVRELYSGCICCSLRGDLVTSLRQLEEEQAPDVVILEPSGVAAPGAILDAFKGYPGALDGLLLLVLADLPRMERLIGHGMMFFEAGIREAHLVALTKADAAAESLKSASFAEISWINPAAQVHLLSAQTGDGMAAFLDALSARLAACTAAAVETREENRPAPRPDAAACSEEAMRIFDQAVETEHLALATAGIVRGLADDLKSQGRDVLGHIKAIVEVPGGGYAAFSLTGAEAEPQRRGNLGGGTAARATLRVNAILCGIPKAELASLLQIRVETFRQIGRSPTA